MVEAIILAGGRGTRLSSVVPDVPKPMAPVAGLPFLSYLLDILIRQGFKRIFLSIGYRGEMIREYFGASFRGTEIVYVREESPLGTGGAIRSALSVTTAPNVFVLNGDTIAEVNLRAMYTQHSSSDDLLTVALANVYNSSRYGAVSVRDGHVEQFAEKGVRGSGYINVGVYLLRRGLFDAMPLPEVFSFEKEVLMDRVGELRPGVFPCSGYFVDIGVPEDYARAQHELPSLLL